MNKYEKDSRMKRYEMFPLNEKNSESKIVF